MFPDPETVERVIKGMDIAGIHPSLKLLCDAAAAGLALHQAISQPTDEVIEELAQAFHENYERLAPSFGYETRTATRVPWPPSNADLMRATARAAFAAVASVLLADEEGVK